MDVLAVTLTLQNLTALVTAVQGFVVQIATSAAAVMGACAVIAKYLPPPEQPGLMAKVHKVINTAACNSGYAENKG